MVSGLEHSFLGLQPAVVGGDTLCRTTIGYPRDQVPLQRSVDKGYWDSIPWAFLFLRA